VFDIGLNAAGVLPAVKNWSQRTFNIAKAWTGKNDDHRPRLPYTSA